MINCKPANPGCKPFVQPQLVPPIHGHQVAEPLMSQFMSNHIRDPILESCVGFPFIVQDSGGSVGDQTPVFHGTHGELVNSEEIGFGEGVFDTKNVGEVVDGLVGMFQGETALLFETAGSIYSNR